MDLEAKLLEVQKEVVEGGATRKTRLATDWIPRPPERFELTGHRAPVTKVTFHPTYRYYWFCILVCRYNDHFFCHTAWCCRVQRMLLSRYIERVCVYIDECYTSLSYCVCVMARYGIMRQGISRGR